jgi:hypothetical protein
MRLARAIGTLEPPTLRKPVQRLFADDVTAWHHHRRVFVCSLFFGDGANEDRVKVVRGGKRNFGLMLKWLR